MASISTWMLPGRFLRVGQHLYTNNLRKSVPGLSQTGAGADRGQRNWEGVIIYTPERGNMGIT